MAWKRSRVRVPVAPPFKIMTTYSEEPKPIMATLSLGQWARLFFVIALMLYSFSGWLWYSKIYSSPERVYWGMFNVMLGTRGVTKHASQAEGQTTGQEYTTLSFAGKPVIHSFTEITSKEDAGDTMASSAAVVGVMIAHMGAKLAFEALAELVDTGLDAEEVEAIRATLLNTHGVRSLHELRTRKMADNALVDAHIIVDPKISVSEGHYIAEAARHAVLQHHHVLDVMVHIDPEDDMRAKPNAHLPSRPGLLALLAERLGDESLGNESLAENRVVFHYLDGKVDAEIYLHSASVQRADELQSRCNLLRDDDIFREIHIYRTCAQS